MSEGATAAVVSITFTTISGCILILRCISRCMIHRFGLDDIFAIAAYFASVATSATLYVQVQHGLGKDIQEVEYNDLVYVLKYTFYSILAYGCCMVFIKVSALLQYLRFLVEPRVRIFCWALMIICVVCGTAAELCAIFQCTPVSFSWNRAIPGGKCIDELAWWCFAAVWVIITDIIVVAIPVFTIKDLTMPRRQKCILICVFALGGLGCIASIIRLRPLIVAATTMNFTKFGAGAAMWSGIEMNIGIICTSLPPLKALVNAMAPRLLADKPIQSHPNEWNPVQSGESSEWKPSTNV